MHDSAVASVQPVLAAAVEDERLDRLLRPREEVLLDGARNAASSASARSSAPGATKRSTCISVSRAQIVTSTPSPSPPASSSACASADSETP